jgi:hypothetical protein
MTDKTLMVNLKEGDLDAFQKIFSKYRKKVYFFALSYLKSKDKAEDIILNHIRKTNQEIGYRNNCIESSAFFEHQDHEKAVG